MNAAPNNPTESVADFPSAPPQPEKTAPPPETELHYNPMAGIIERHENAVNRLKRGK